MDRFGHVLRRVDRELGVPEPERSRILLELAGDLEDLYRAYRERGLPEGEARRRAEGWLAPSDGSLAGLREMHTPLVGRLLDPLSDVARSRLERGLLTLLSLAAVGGGLAAVAASGVLWPPGPEVVVVLALAAAMAWIAGRSALDMRLHPDRQARVSSRLPALPAFGGAAAVTGLLGGLVRVYLALGRTGGGSGAESAPWGEIGSAAGAAALGLSVALLGALAWLWLALSVADARRARARLIKQAELSPESDERRMR